MFNLNPIFSVNRGTTIRWRCVKRTDFCKGILTTNLQYEDPVIVTDHNHAPSQNAVSVCKCVANMKPKAVTSEDAPGQIYSSHITELTAEEKASLPNSDTIKRTLRNQRSKMHPPIPASLHDLVIEG